jgi:hypothetical protein
VDEQEAREMAYHYVRIHMQEKTRPGRLKQAAAGNGHDEPVWEVELVSRTDGTPERLLVIGRDTGSIYGCHSLVSSQEAAR